MSTFTRSQIVQLLEIEESFLISLESEEIIQLDAPAEAPTSYSEQMLERARVAHNLVTELDVNMAGAAIIVRMREDMSSLRLQLEDLVTEIRRLKKEA